MSIVIDFPPTAPLRTVTMPSPVDGNLDRLQTNAIKRKTRAGVVKALDDWVDFEIFTYSFTAVTASALQDLREILSLSTGLEVRITDHHLVARDGYIISSDVEVIAVRDNCSYDVSFDFKESS